MNTIISKEPIKFHNIISADDFLRNIKKERLKFTENYMGLDDPRRMNNFIRAFEDLTDELKQYVDSWDKECYVLEAQGKDFDFSERKYTFENIKLRHVIREFDKMSTEEENTTEYAKMLKFSNEDIDNWYYKKIGIYNDLPLYIHSDIKDIIKSNKFNIKEIHHEEVRSEFSEDVHCNGRTYERIEEHIWFLDGIVITDENENPVWVVGETGVFNRDWNGIEARTFKSVEISGPVEFKTFTK